ncbi:unnamed protein product [Cuscuta campestris]|uniref:Uncharacterized protein n=1 Tax=Cuscuta campestris TaxID=132261 RepID=A0A484N886_9ASTE|nr:unnamed protein product [Cuscuta campestris]
MYEVDQMSAMAAKVDSMMSMVQKIAQVSSMQNTMPAPPPVHVLINHPGFSWSNPSGVANPQAYWSSPPGFQNQQQQFRGGQGFANNQQFKQNQSFPYATNQQKPIPPTLETTSASGLDNIVDQLPKSQLAQAKTLKQITEELTQLRAHDRMLENQISNQASTSSTKVTGKLPACPENSREQMSAITIRSGKQFQSPLIPSSDPDEEIGEDAKEEPQNKDKEDASKMLPKSIQIKEGKKKEDEGLISKYAPPLQEFVWSATEIYYGLKFVADLQRIRDGIKNARVDPSIDEGRLRKAFLRKAAERYASYTYNQRNPTRLKKKKMDPRPLEQLKKVWEEDPEFLELSKIKKKNIRKGKEDGPALGTYCGGSIPFSENMNRLAKKKGAPVLLDEVIIHTKTKKHDGKTWVDPGHAELQAQFFELREEARQNGLKVTDEEIWYSLVEGHNAKNRVPGVGDYVREMKKINPSSKPHRSSTSSSSTAEMAALKEQNQRLHEQLDNLTSSLSLTIQEEIRKLYGGNLPPRGDDDGMGGAGQPGIC